MSFPELENIGRALAVAGALALLGACAASSPVPPDRDPYFPASLALSPDERHLFIANANSDLRFGAGSVQVYDLDAVKTLLTAWNGGASPVPEGCRQNVHHPELAHCPSSIGNQPAGYVAAARAQIGNFVSALRVQPLDDGKLRLFGAVRGDPSITWLDFDPATVTLDCGGSGSFPRCDDRHLINSYVTSPTQVGITSEPFGIAVDAERQHVLITHLTTGNVSLVRAPRNGDLPTLEDSLTGLWAPIATNNPFNVVSAVGVAARLPGDESGLFYVTSHSEARINLVRALDTTRPDGAPGARLVRASSFFYAPAPAGNGSVGDARGITFSKDGNQAFVVARTPASLMIFDTSMDPTGTPRNQLLGQVELCPRPNDVVLVEPDPSQPEGTILAYVPCFDTGEVWVVDTDHVVLDATIQVGLGPEAVVIAPASKLAFVANYGEDTISVIDLDTAHATYHHAVLQLGKLRGEN